MMRQNALVRGVRVWRAIGVTGVWLAATTFGVAVVWLGLGPVLDAAVPDRQVPLTAEQVRTLPTSPAPAATRSIPPGLATASPRRTGPAVAPTPSRPVSPQPAGTQTDGWTLVGPDTYEQTFTVGGGTVVMRVSPGKATAVSMAPAAGYAAEKTQSDPARVVVQFVAPGVSDTVDAMWWEGRPYAQVSHVS